MVEAIDDPIFVHDADARIVLANPSYARHAGLARDEVIGRPYWDAFPRGAVLPAAGQASREDGGCEVRLGGGKAFRCWSRAIACEAGGELTLRILRDVTREHLAAIVESTAEAVVGTDLSGLTTSWNSAAETTYGYAVDEAMGRPLADFFSPERRLELERALDQARAGRPTALQTEGLAKDGTRFQVALTLSPIRDHSGSICGCSGISREIGDCVAAERRLVEVQRIAGLGNWEWDISTGRLWWSEEIYRIFGLAGGEEMTYARFLLSMPPEDRVAVESAVGDALHRRHSYDIGHRIVVPDGSVRYVHERGEVVWNAGGDPLRMIGTVQDVTAQRLAELTLWRLNRAIWMLNRCYDALTQARAGDGLFEAICRIIVEVGGYRLAWIGLAEQGGATHLRTVAQFGADGVRKAPAGRACTTCSDDNDPVGRAIRTGNLQIVEDVMADAAFASCRENAAKQGYKSLIVVPILHELAASAVLVIYSAAPGAFDTDEVGLLQELADVLRSGMLGMRARAEREQRQGSPRRRRDDHDPTAHQLRVALLGELAASLAHDLREPLNLIRLTAENGLGHCRAGGHPEVMRRSFGVVLAQTGRVHATIDHILSFARAEETPSALIAPVAAIDSAVALVRSRYLRDGVALIWLPPRHCPNVFGIPIRLEQVLVNLLTNACDAVADDRRRRCPAENRGGTVEVTCTGQIETGVHIAVIDDGPGIPEPLLDAIFRPFVTTKSSRKGTGLGLSISLGIIAEMHGRLQATNLEKGVRFDIWLPAHPA